MRLDEKIFGSRAAIAISMRRKYLALNSGEYKPVDVINCCRKRVKQIMLVLRFELERGSPSGRGNEIRIFVKFCNKQTRQVLFALQNRNRSVMVEKCQISFILHRYRR